MEANGIKLLILNEVRAHEYGLGNHHVEEITDAIIKQLREYMTDEEMSKMVVELRSEFVKVVDELIPIVEEYEGKIEMLLDKHIGQIVTKNRGS